MTAGGNELRRAGCPRNEFGHVGGLAIDRFGRVRLTRLAHERGLARPARLASLARDRRQPQRQQHVRPWRMRRGLQQRHVRT